MLRPGVRTLGITTPWNWSLVGSGDGMSRLLRSAHGRVGRVSISFAYEAQLRYIRAPARTKRHVAE